MAEHGAVNPLVVGSNPTIPALDVAQRSEHRSDTPCVVGSTPIIQTGHAMKYFDVMQSAESDRVLCRFSSDGRALD